MSNFSTSENIHRRPGRPRKDAIIQQESVPDQVRAAFAMPCAFVIERHKTTAPSGDIIMHDTVCGEPAETRAVLKFIGQRREETFPRSKVYVQHDYTWYLDCGPVCEKHKTQVRRDFGTLLPNSRFSAEIKSFSDQGFPTPDEKLTRLVWREVQAPPLMSEHRTSIPETDDEKDVA